MDNSRIPPNSADTSSKPLILMVAGLVTNQDADLHLSPLVDERSFGDLVDRPSHDAQPIPGRGSARAHGGRDPTPTPPGGWPRAAIARPYLWGPLDVARAFPHEPFVMGLLSIGGPVVNRGPGDWGTL